MPSEPVPPRPAATVLLVRDHPEPAPGRAPLQVFLQRRVAGMAFAGGMTVFPGGGVDPADVPEPDRWRGPDPSWWGARLGCSTSLAGALVQAAVRETFEECGVLLATGPPGAGAVDPAWLRAARTDLIARRRTLGHLLAEADLTVRADLLRGWARWITPEVEPRRYDTAFFVAVLPSGQDADAHTTEAVEATWWYPVEALEQRERGEIGLMAPTIRTLREIAEHPDSASVLAAAEHREIRPITPRVVHRDGVRRVLLPEDPGFDVAADHLTREGRA
ncbi:MAG TPA: NUDIX hydrolase [Pseudonocardia sp.]|nr:NUDIX hydrolase [Pseudonocardia sp.]